MCERNTKDGAKIRAMYWAWDQTRGIKQEYIKVQEGKTGFLGLEEENKGLVKRKESDKESITKHTYRLTNKQI